jgi:nicotinic acid mononucleotide adenylyltransferase
LGGSFDPPTLAHVQIASEIYNTHEDVDEVWIVPCGDGRGDKSLKTKGLHRLAMLELILTDIIGNNAPIKVFKNYIDR